MYICLTRILYKTILTDSARYHSILYRGMGFTVILDFGYEIVYHLL